MATVLAPSQNLTRCPHPLVEEIFSSRQIPTRDGGYTPLNVYIPREQGDFLYSLVRERQPALTIEIGMANGLSSLFIASALRDNGFGTHVAIDPFQHSDWGGVGMGLMAVAGLDDLVRLVEKPSHQALPQLEQEGLRSTFVFIDGSHVFDYVMTDFLGSDRLLDVGGLLAFDDSDWSAIRPVIRYALSNRDYRVARPDMVIEPPPGRQSWAGNMLRKLAGRVPKLARYLRDDFLHTDRELGIEGRCVVLEKQALDDRDSQDRDAHWPF